MKMAAAEALWETEAPAGESLFAIPNVAERRNTFDIRIPGELSFLAANNFTAEVRGINDIQAEYEQKFGPGNYIPPILASYWLFRLMVGVGMLMILLAFAALYLFNSGKLKEARWFLRLLPFAILLPYLGNSFGWLFTKIGRQPWIVFGLMRVEDAVSPAVSVGELWISLIGFVLIYTLLMVFDVQLLVKYAKTDPNAESAAAHTG